MSSLVLLGPQTHDTTIGLVAEAIGMTGPVALVTAGWEEREQEDSELTERLGLPTVNLELFGRTEAVFAEDPDLFEAIRQRHDRLRGLARIYRLRLDHALASARELLGFARQTAMPDGRGEEDARAAPAGSHPDLLHPEQQDALREIHRLDCHHLQRVHEIHAAFAGRWQPRERESLKRARNAVLDILQNCPSVAIAGGHVLVLLNRLRLFGLRDELQRRDVLAWSAGAMCMTRQIVLFHDSPPQGAGNPEVLEEGLGLAEDLVALPHANHRLRLDDPVRVQLLARRFAPATCVGLDAGCRVDVDSGGWTAHPPTRVLRASGEVAAIGAP